MAKSACERLDFYAGGKKKPLKAAKKEKEELDADDIAMQKKIKEDKEKLKKAAEAMKKKK